MVRRLKFPDRRPLFLPAVHPCPCVLPATLLTSLIALSCSISGYGSELFATQRRSAREVVRLVAALSVLFEEILGQEMEVSEFMVMCLSEVHVSLQKIKFLLEDCSREGARVWILMNSWMVAAQFGAAARGFAIALDALPVDDICVSKDVKELVELVSRQAWKEKFEVDVGDKWAMETVGSILDGLKVGIEPNREVVKRVLDYLRIRSWNDCDDEIWFLEEKMQCEGEKEAVFLSSLLGFMCYCRGVMFEFENRQTSLSQRVETLSCFHLEDFRCPISLELMTDPVTVSTGHTYDRSSIRRWLDAGKSVCPKTGQELSSKELVSNLAMKRLVEEFRAANGIPPPNSGKRTHDNGKTAVPRSQVAGHAIRKLCRFLTRRLVFGSLEQKNNAAGEISLLTKSNIFNQKCLIEAGTILPLLNLLTVKDASAQENAIAALSKLAKQSIGKRAIINWGGLDTILMVLKKGMRLESRQMAAATIFYLSSGKGNQKLIGEVSDVIPALVDLIRDGRTCGKQNSMVTIFRLLLHPGNHQRVLDAGVVPLLINILACSDRPELLTDTLAVLSALSEYEGGAIAILRTPGLPLITELLRSMETKEGKEHCISILLSLCGTNTEGKDILRVMARDPTLISSLYSLLTEGTCHAKRKARMLIKLILNFNER
ncbi:hypothetical protein MLD38_031985 [Melastoma candidum]|uniref:Uncharacterized protein n=1 Tax=Melastoma candidum TaxID=119954 RepID=A0ACB9MQU2_9MYRT|nr:hypothetical protein MLD38_031985 [Melastoma candidum]